MLKTGTSSHESWSPHKHGPLISRNPKLHYRVHDRFVLSHTLAPYVVISITPTKLFHTDVSVTHFQFQTSLDNPTSKLNIKRNKLLFQI
jgi:hypothetical protein